MAMINLIHEISNCNSKLIDIISPVSCILNMCRYNVENLELVSITTKFKLVNKFLILRFIGYIFVWIKWKYELCQP